MKKPFYHKKSFLFALILFLISLVFSIWLLQENGTWDLFAFLFVGLPLNIILGIILLVTSQD
ncbi:hypothetical protein [uncultured Kordia sp.]|uniref:hypothetical protein n=1 Tax=uncultured Kordia sp. TaxID=507699 RepID=UPI00261479FD|nr:hypothetical protein [uncultured Kordia sp.]